jgi:hypothetical protein
MCLYKYRKILVCVRALVMREARASRLTHTFFVRRAFTFGGHCVQVLCRATPPGNDDDNSQESSTSSSLHDSTGCSLVQRLSVHLAQQLEELGAETEDTVGWDIWEGATELLCEHVAENPLLVQGKRVLEIGAGVGVVGLIAAKCGARSVVISDYDQGALCIAQGMSLCV